MCLRAGLNIMESLITLLNSRTVQPVTSLCINNIKSPNCSFHKKSLYQLHLSPERPASNKSLNKYNNPQTDQPVTSLSINYIKSPDRPVRNKSLYQLHKIPRLSSP